MNPTPPTKTKLAAQLERYPIAVRERDAVAPDLTKLQDQIASSWQRSPGATHNKAGNTPTTEEQLAHLLDLPLEPDSREIWEKKAAEFRKLRSTYVKLAAEIYDLDEAFKEAIQPLRHQLGTGTAKLANEFKGRVQALIAPAFPESEFGRVKLKSFITGLDEQIPALAELWHTVNVKLGSPRSVVTRLIGGINDLETAKAKLSA